MTHYEGVDMAQSTDEDYDAARVLAAALQDVREDGLNGTAVAEIKWAIRTLIRDDKDAAP